MTIPKIKWVSLNNGERDTCGNWRSLEGRFEIFPRYRSTVNPDSYSLRDSTKPGQYLSFGTVRAAKERANEIVRDETERQRLAYRLDT